MGEHDDDHTDQARRAHRRRAPANPQHPGPVPGHRVDTQGIARRAGHLVRVRCRQSGDDLTEHLLGRVDQLERFEDIERCTRCDAEGYIAGGEDGDPIRCYRLDNKLDRLTD